MMAYLSDFLALGVISLLGAISPGPDFIIVTQNALSHGRKAGVFTALGIAIGCLIHISYCILGLGVIVTQSVVLFNLIKYLGAAYLIYLGVKGLFATHSNTYAQNTTSHVTSITAYAAFKKGLLVNLLNPKVALFILSIFTQMIVPHTPFAIQILYGLEFSLIGFGWFTLLSFILSNNVLKKKLLVVQHYVEKLLSVFLIMLGIKIAQFSQ